MTLMHGQSDPGTSWRHARQQRDGEHRPELDLPDDVDPIYDNPFEESGHSHHNATIHSMNVNEELMLANPDEDIKPSKHSQATSSETTSDLTKGFGAGPLMILQVDQPNLSSTLQESSAEAPVTISPSKQYHWAPLSPSDSDAAAPFVPPHLHSPFEYTNTHTRGSFGGNLPSQVDGPPWRPTLSTGWRLQSLLPAPADLPLSSSSSASSNPQSFSAWSSHTYFCDQESKITMNQTLPSLRSSEQDIYSSTSGDISEAWPTDLGYQTSAGTSIYPGLYPTSTTSLGFSEHSRAKQGYKKRLPLRPSNLPVSPFHAAVYGNHHSYSNCLAFEMYQKARPGNALAWAPNSKSSPLDRLSTTTQMLNDENPLAALSTSTSGEDLSPAMPPSMPIVDSMPVPMEQGQHQQQDYPTQETRRTLTKHQLQAMDPDPKYCDNCRTTTTPSWRRCPQGRILLCNACGLYQKLHGKSRPFFKARDGTIKIHRTLPEHTPCTKCGTTKTPVWKKSANHETICLGCSLIFKHAAAEASRSLSHTASSTPLKGAILHTPTAKSHSCSGTKSSTMLRDENGRYINVRDAQKRTTVEGISKRKRIGGPKQRILQVDGLQTYPPSHVALPIGFHGSEFRQPCGSDDQSSVAWDSHHQQQYAHQPSHSYSSLSSNGHSSFMRSASNGAFDGSGYYWDTQHHHRYPSQAQPSYFREEQLQYSSALQHGLPLQHLQYQPYHQSYHCHGPTSMVHSNTNTYVPETDTCSSTAMVSNTTTTTGLFPEIQGSAETSSSAIPAAMSHLYPPIYPSSEPSSEPLQRDDVVPIDSQAGEQGFKHVANPNATSSSPLVRPRLFSSPLVHMGDDVLKEERKKDRYVSIDTVGTTGSELSSVQDYASD